MSSINLDTYINSIKVGDQVLTKGKNTNLKNSSFRLVKKIPPYKCRNYVYEPGFRIQVGKNSYVNIPVWWLKCSVIKAKANGGVFNKAILEMFAEKEVKNKPCVVHTVAGILVMAGIAKQIETRDFKILI